MAFDKFARDGLAALGILTTQGDFPASAGASGRLGAGLTSFRKIPMASGYLGAVSVWSGVATAAKLVLASKNDSDQFTTISSFDVTLVVGRNSFNLWNPLISAGNYLGIFTAGDGPSYDASGGEGIWYTSGVPGTDTASTSSAGLLAHFGWQILTGEKAKTLLNGSAIAAIQGSDAGSGGVLPPTAGTASLIPGLTILGRTAFGVDAQAYEWSVWAGSAVADARLCVVAINADGSLQLISMSDPMPLAVGLNTLTSFQPFVKAAWFPAVYSSGALNYQSPASGFTLNYCVGLPGAATAKLSNANQQLQMGWKLRSGAENAARGEAFRAIGAETVLKAQINGGATTGGTFPAGAYTNHLVGGYTTYSEDPITSPGQLARVSVEVAAAGPGKLVLATKNASNQYTQVATFDVSFAAGVNALFWRLPVLAAQISANLYLGAYTVAGGVGYTSFTGKNPRYHLGLPGTNTPSTALGNNKVGIGWEIIAGLDPRTGSLEAGLVAAQAGVNGLSNAGIGLLASADNTGAIDATAAFAAALASHPTPYVPVGNYAVTALPRFGEGFWGPGKVYVNGVRYPLPNRPRDGSLLLDFRSSLSRLTSSGSPLVLIGDSLSAHFEASNLARTWFNQIEDFANLQFAPGSEPSTVVLRNDNGTTGETAAFYGITLSGGTNGTAGPVGKSVVLADGGYIEFTGAYQTVEAFYQRAVGAGSLVRTFNGASSVTITAAGAAASDVISAFGATGQAVSGTWRIAATGGPVELTGLIRHTDKLSTAGTPNALRCMRAAYGGYTTTSFTDARLDSIIAQALALGPAPEYLVALMTNDAFYGQAPRQDTYFTNLTRIVSRLQNQGAASRVSLITPTRPKWTSSKTPGSALTGGDFDSFIAIADRVRTAAGIRLLRLDAMDFDGAGLLNVDGIHWSDPAQDKVADAVIRWRAEA